MVVSRNNPKEEEEDDLDVEEALRRMEESEDDSDGKSEPPEEEGVKCTDCDQSFTTLRAMRLHFNWKHKEGGRGETLRDTKETVRKKMKNIKRWSLKREFAVTEEVKCLDADLNSALNDFVKVIEGEETYKYACKGCNKTYKQKEHVKLHAETHLNNVYVCSLCPHTSFKTRKNMRNHMSDQHRGMRDIPYKRMEAGSKQGNHRPESRASTASQQTSDEDEDNADLESSRESSVANKESSNGLSCNCNICGRLFQSESSLKGHMTWKHPREGVRCKLCKELFANQSILNCHYKWKHSKRKHSILEEEEGNDDNNDYQDDHSDD